MTKICMSRELDQKYSLPNNIRDDNDACTYACPHACTYACTTSVNQVLHSLICIVHSSQT